MSDAPVPKNPEPPAAPGGSGEWDHRFTEHPWPADPDPTLVELVAPLPPGRALDLACGPGRNAIWLAGRGWAVTGIDASGVALAQARQRAGDAGVAILTVQADLRDHEPPAGRFDLVVVAYFHLQEPDRQRLFDRAAAALRSGGHLFVVGHHLDSLGRAGPPDPERLYTEERLRAAFPRLMVERLQRCERPSESGEGPLVDLIVWAARP